MDADVVGGFPIADPNCKGCGKPLLIENAWMTDGCPCNTPLGVNSMNETRWRLLQQLQQQQAHELESIRTELAHMRDTDAVQDRQALLENVAALSRELETLKAAGESALAFLKRAAFNEHRIVSSGDLTPMQITEAQARKLFYVEPGGGLGWALVPWELTTPKDRKREEEYFANKK